jgi:predicted glycosyltransferase
MIDVLTPKHALLFGKVKERLERKGCKTYIASRKYIELTNIFKISRIKPLIVGEHGGAALYNKLLSSLERTIRLSRLMRRIMPDVVLSFSSPEAARAAFGLNIPHISVNDSPHSIYVAKLTIPLSRKLLTPKIVGRKIWIKYGIKEEDIVVYNSLDPVAWLRDFTPNMNVLRKYGLVKGGYFVFRPEEYEASYLRRGGFTAEIVSRIYSSEKDLRGLRLVIVPRYEEKKYFRLFKGCNPVLLEHGEDTRSILFYSMGFIGAGGTMNAEAALLRVPTMSIYPSSTIVEEFLVKKGLVAKASDARSLRSWLKRIASKEFDEKERISSLAKVRKMEDPSEKIAETCLRLTNS